MAVIQYQPQADPLRANEFENFETVPDGVLYEDELVSKELLDSFVSRLIKTSVPSDADEFIGRLSTGLKLKVRSCLMEICEDPSLMAGLTADDLERLKAWLETDFIVDNISAGMSAGYKYTTYDYEGQFSFIEGDDAYLMNYHEDHTTHDFSSSAWVWGKHLGPRGLWQRSWSTTLDFSGIGEDQLSEYEYVYDGEAYPEEPYEVDQATQSLRVSPTVGFVRTDEKGGFAVGGFYEEHFNQISDSTLRTFEIEAEGQVRKIKGSGFSIYGSGGYGEEYFTEPFIEGQQQRFERSVAFSLDPSLQVNEKVGLTTDADFTFTQSTGHYDQTRGFDVDAFVLSQATLSSIANMRFGVGGVYENKDSQRIDVPVHDVSEEGDVAGQAILDVDGDLFGVYAKVQGNYNFSQGSYVGSYPSIEDLLILKLTPKKSEFKLSVSHSGSHWSMDYVHLPGEEYYFDEGEYSKTSHELEGSLYARVTPRDFLQVSSTVSASQLWESGFMAASQTELAGNAKLSLRLKASKPEMWVYVQGGGGYMSYADQFEPGSSYHYPSGWAYVGLSTNHIPVWKK